MLLKPDQLDPASPPTVAAKLHAPNTPAQDADPTPDGNEGPHTQAWTPTRPPEDSPEGSQVSTPVQIGKFRVQSLIGEGGMGKVFLVHDPDLHQLVVAKTIRTGSFAGKHEREQFQREAVALAQVKHPNIIQVHYADLNREPPFLVMEYMPKGSLSGHMDRFHGDRRASVAFVEKVARAVHHIHERDYIHRDLKPGNILLDDNLEPKVSDFGLAKFLQSEANWTYTEAGTPSYMAPEQTDLVDHKVERTADVWALGVILFQLLTGKLPFEADKNLDPESSRKSLFRKICQAEPPQLRVLDSSLDKNLEAVILKCLEKSPDRRYSNAQELADELQRWIKGDPLQTRPERLPRKISRVVRRRPIAAATLFVLLLSASVAPALVWFTHPDRPLWTIESAISQGKAVDLVSANGGPAWHDWILDGGRMMTDENQAFKVESWDFASFALVRNVNCSRYAFRAEIKHLTSDLPGSVGMFVMNGKEKIGQERVCSSINLTFNDVVRPSRKNPKRPNGVQLGATFVHDRDGKSAIFRGYGRGGAFLLKNVPAPIKQRQWHEVIMLVDGDHVSVLFDGHPIGPISAGDLRRYIRKDLQNEQIPIPKTLLPADGSAGLIVNRASVMFRNVRLEPHIQPAAKEKVDG